MGAGLCAFLVGPIQSTIARVASGEFDRVPEVNDAFLELAGYCREDLLAGRLHWPDLTPPEGAPLDELAHEEGVKIPLEPAGSATLEQVEREHIIRVPRENRGVVTTVATRLGLHRITLNAMMRKHGISRNDL